MVLLAAPSGGNFIPAIPPNTSVAHIPTPPIQTYTIPNTPQVPISYQLQSYPNYAAQAVQSAYSAITNSTNNAYTYVTNNYNNAYTTVAQDYNQDRTAAIDAINNATQNISANLHDTLNTVNNTVANLHNDLINNNNNIVQNINADVHQLSDRIGTEISANIASVQHSYDNIAYALIHNADEQQRQQQNVIQAFYEAQNRIIQQTHEESRDVIDRTAGAITSGFDRVINEIENITANPHGLFGIPDDEIAKFIKEILQLVNDAVSEDLRHIGIQGKQLYAETLDAQTGAFKDVPHRFSDVFKKLKNDEYTSLDDFISDFSGTQVGHLLFDFVLNITTALSGASKLTDVATAPYYQKLIQLGLSDVTPTIPDISELVRLLFRSQIGHPDYTEMAKKLGFSEKLANNILKSSYTKLTAYEYLRNTFMFQGNVDDMKIQLHHLGYDSSDIDIMIDNYLGGIPPIQDLIRFMVRDTFSPIAEKYGQFEDFPEKIMDYWSAQPIGDMWARHYWASHWELPSIQQAIEMFQRRDGASDKSIISFEELQQFLKAKDVMPFWREKLTKVAYHPITRIDVRRIYNMGGKDKHWIYNQYLNAGYSPQDASDLADFVANSQSESDETINKHIRKIAEQLIKISFDREIINANEAQTRLTNAGMNTREAAITAQLWQFDKDTERDYRIKQTQTNQIVVQVKMDYEKRIIDKDYATNLMLGAGLTQQEINHELQYADTKAFLKLRELQIDAIHVEFVKWRLDRNQAIQRLQGIGAKQGEIEYLLLLWTAEREKKDRQLNETDVNKIYQAGKMSVEQYRRYMTTLGFDAQEIAWLEGLHSPDASQ